jgi:hypothetical protein
MPLRLLNPARLCIHPNIMKKSEFDQIRIPELYGISSVVLVTLKSSILLLLVT